jgi:hypothetical protein
MSVNKKLYQSPEAEIEKFKIYCDVNTSGEGFESGNTDIPWDDYENNVNGATVIY